MNKKYLIFIANILFFIVGSTKSIFATTPLSFGNQERDFLRAMYELENDFAKIPVIRANIDNFIGVMQINVQLGEKRLEVATKKANKARNAFAGLLAGAFVARNIIDLGKFLALHYGFYSVRQFLNNNFGSYMYMTASQLIAVCSMAQMSYSAVKLYDVYKQKNALRDELAVDQAILAKLIAIKESIEYTVNINEIVA